jgi:hypothetical protein
MNLGCHVTCHKENDYTLSQTLKQNLTAPSRFRMAQRANFYAHDEYEEDLGDVNIEAVVGNYGQGGHGLYEDGGLSGILWIDIHLTEDSRSGEDRRRDYGRDATPNGSASCIFPDPGRCQTSG